MNGFAHSERTPLRTLAERVPEETYLTKLAQGAAISLVGRVFGRATSAFTHVILARFLGPQDFGLYAVGWTTLQLVGALTVLGLDRGVVYYGLGHRESGQYLVRSVLWQSIGLACALGTVFGTGLYLCAPWLATQVFGKANLISVFYWFAPALCFFSGLRVAAAASRISQRMQFSIYTEEVLQPGAHLLLIFTFFTFGWKLQGAVGAATISFGLSFLLALFYIKKLFLRPLPVPTNPPILAAPTLRDVLGFSLPTAVAGVLMMLTVWADRLLVSYYCSAADIGVYQAAAQCGFMLAIVLSAFNAIFSPLIADLYRKGEIGKLDRLFKISTKWGLYCCVPFGLVLILAPWETMTFLFGHHYRSGAVVLSIVTITQLINVGTGAVDHLLIMTGQQRSWVVISAFMLFVNLTMGFLLIPRWGLLGAALATAATYTGLFVAGLLHVKRTLRVWPYEMQYLKGLLAAVLAGFAVVLFRASGVGPPGIILSGSAVASLLVFGVTLFALGFDHEDREFLDLMWRRNG